VSDVLPKILSKISGGYQERGDLLLAAWPGIIGPAMAQMTEAVSFVDGVLTVKVKNSSLLSLLSRHEKFRIQKALEDRFPRAGIRNIIFRIA
jgi:hypothetical protein